MNLAKLRRDAHSGRPVAKRTPNSIHIETDEGIVAYINGGNDYHLPNGDEIDTAWEAVNQDGYNWLMERALYRGEARTVFNAGDLVRFSHSGAWVIFDPQSINWINQDNSRQQISIKQAVNATAGTGDDDNLLTWAQGYGAGRHMSYRCVPERLEKLITIDAPSNLPAPTVTGTVWFEAEFILKHSTGLNIYLDGVLWTKQNNQRVKTASRVEFRNAAGESLFYLSAPFARDSGGDETSGEYEVRAQAGTFFVTVRVLKTWLDAAQWPVMIDPTLEVVGGSSYGNVNGVNADYSTARSTSTTQVTTAMNTANTWATATSNYSILRSFVRFDTSEILSSDTISQVNLRMVATAINASNNFDVQIIKQDWSAQDPLDSGNREAAYDNCLAGDADDSIWRNTSGASTNTQYTSGNLSTAWIVKGGTTYYSLRNSRDFNANVPTGSEQVGLATPDNANADYRPTLIVVYIGDLSINMVEPGRPGVIVT